MVEDWIQKRKLSKLGFHFDSSNLSDFEVACYAVITDKFGDLEIAEMDRKNKQGNMA